jgi:hypothetical protein
MNGIEGRIEHTKRSDSAVDNLRAGQEQQHLLNQKSGSPMDGR